MKIAVCSDRVVQFAVIGRTLQPPPPSTHTAHNYTQNARREIKGIDLPRPFPRLPYADAIGRYGSDKPDTRFGLEFSDISSAVAGCGFRCVHIRIYCHSYTHSYGVCQRGR